MPLPSVASDMTRCKQVNKRICISWKFSMEESTCVWSAGGFLVGIFLGRVKCKVGGVGQPGL